MPEKEEIEKLKAKVGDHQYHHVECDVFAEMKIAISSRGRRHPELFETMAISSKKTIGEGLKAVRESPFKTVFVVRVDSGEVLFALSQNDEYVVHARKKKPKPKPVPPTPQPTDCCRLCSYQGGTGCDDLGDGSCICFGADRGIGAGLDDPLETWAF